MKSPSTGLLHLRSRRAVLGLALSFVAAQSSIGCDEGAKEKMVPDVALPTYPPDYFSGDRACGGFLLERLRISIRPNEIPFGETVPDNPDRGPSDLVWPEGFVLRDASGGSQVVGPGGVVISNGTVLGRVSACLGESGSLFIVDVGEVLDR